MSTIDYAALLANAQNVTSTVAPVTPAPAGIPADQAAAFAAFQAAQAQAAAQGAIAPAPAISATVAAAYAGDNPFAGTENAEIAEYGKPPLPRSVQRDISRDPKCNITSALDATYDLVLKKFERKRSRKGVEYMKAHFAVLDGNGDSEVGSDVEATWFKNSDYFDKEIKGFVLGLMNLNKNDKAAVAKALQDLISPKQPLTGRVVRVRVTHSKAKKEPFNDYFRNTWIPIQVTGKDPTTGKPVITLAVDNRGL